jgi:hypothetical protein
MRKLIGAALPTFGRRWAILKEESSQDPGVIADRPVIDPAAGQNAPGALSGGQPGSAGGS